MIDSGMVFDIEVNVTRKALKIIYQTDSDTFS